MLPSFVAFCFQRRHYGKVGWVGAGFLRRVTCELYENNEYKDILRGGGLVRPLIDNVECCRKLCNGNRY